MGVEEIFSAFELDTEEKREKFTYYNMTHEDEIDINGLGLSTYSE